MSEYWKSTPKYWCKFCKTYVKDTKLEKQQHEATPRHQGNIQRSLRTLHRENEREEREKQRAKDEVARLNGIVSGNPVAKPTSSFKPRPQPPPAAPQQTNPEDRKRQMQQLADLGVAIPKEFRADMALAGDWETVSERPIEQDVKPEALSRGVHKRKLEDNDDDNEIDEDGEKPVKRKGWGSTFRTYPGHDVSSEDIGALLNSAQGVKAEDANEEKIKKEEDTDDTSMKPAAIAPGHELDGIVKNEEKPTPDAPIVFKKRKAKVAKPS